MTNGVKDVAGNPIRRSTLMDIVFSFESPLYDFGANPTDPSDDTNLAAGLGLAAGDAAGLQTLRDELGPVLDAFGLRDCSGASPCAVLAYTVTTQSVSAVSADLSALPYSAGSCGRSGHLHGVERDRTRSDRRPAQPPRRTVPERGDVPLRERGDARRPGRRHRRPRPGGRELGRRRVRGESKGDPRSSRCRPACRTPARRPAPEPNRRSSSSTTASTVAGRRCSPWRTIWPREVRRRRHRRAFHGARAYCDSNDECDGGTCTLDAANQKAPGVCTGSNGLVYDPEPAAPPRPPATTSSRRTSSDPRDAIRQDVLDHLRAGARAGAPSAGVPPQARTRSSPRSCSPAPSSDRIRCTSAVSRSAR